MGVNQTVRAIEVKYDSELHFGSLKDKNNIFFKIKALTGNTQSKHQLKTFMRSYANVVYHGIPFTGKSVKRKSKIIISPKMEPLGKVSNTALRKLILLIFLLN